ncbi:MAG: hypothetical protein IJO88_02235 [Oscillospiraceae bacterium]|nr:hypothetical protein [Oscillospiraceae bacterium]
MKVMNANEMREINGGAKYSCKHCGETWSACWPFRWIAELQRDSHQKYCSEQF